MQKESIETNYMLRKQLPSPAQTICKSWTRDAKQHVRYQWLQGLPDQWLETCIENGLLPYLKQKGYCTTGTVKDTVAKFRAWAFAHVWQTRYWNTELHINYATAGPGTQDDFDFMCLQLSSHELEEFMDAWTTCGLFDDSPEGHSQRMDIQQFVWHILDLERSKTHRRWKMAFEEDEQEETVYGQSPHEEGVAYGGDRRTY